MESVREFLTKLKTHHQDEDADEDLLSGPTINIAPGQVKEDVHYMENRGSIDLSYLRFAAEDKPKKPSFNFRFPTNSTNEETTAEAQQALVSNSNSIDNNANDSYYFGGVEDSFVDIVVFEVPEHCTSVNCDLSKFGVGSLQTFNNGVSYLSLCQDGRLHLDNDLFQGHHTHLMIPKEGKMPDRIKQRQYNKFSMPEAKHYEVMLANCHPNARKIRVRGQVVFDLVDDDDVDLAKDSLSVLVSVACLVFLVLTILTVRVNLGTRADFEQSHYGLVPDTDEEETNDAAPEFPPSGSEDDSPITRSEEDDRFRDEEISEAGEHGYVSGMSQATIV